MKKIKTLLFDLDGTLIDSNELIIESFLYTLGKYFPGKYKREDVIPFIGPTLKDTFNTIDIDRSEEMLHDYREFNFTKHDDMMKEFPGVNEGLAALKNTGVRMGIVTSKIHYSAEKSIKLLGMDQYFDCLIGCDDVVKHKPDPEPLLKALNIIGSKPEEAMMIGDRHHDILAGQNTGTLTVGVGWSLQGKDYLRHYRPDYIIDELTDLVQILKKYE